MATNTTLRTLIAILATAITAYSQTVNQIPFQQADGTGKLKSKFLPTQAGDFNAQLYSEQLLIVSGGNVNVSVADATQSRIAIAENTTVTISGATAGIMHTLILTQTSGTAGFSVTLPAGTKSNFGGTNVYMMSGTATTDLLYLRIIGNTAYIEGASVGFTP